MLRVSRRQPQTHLLLVVAVGLSLLRPRQVAVQAEDAAAGKSPVACPRSGSAPPIPPSWTSPRSGPPAVSCAPPPLTLDTSAAARRLQQFRCYHDIYEGQLPGDLADFIERRCKPAAFYTEVGPLL